MHRLSSSLWEPKTCILTDDQTKSVNLLWLSNWILGLFFVWRYSKSILLAMVSEIFTEFRKVSVCIANDEMTLNQNSNTPRL